MNQTIPYKFQKKDWKNKKVFSHIFPDLKDSDEKDSYIDYKELKVYSTFTIDLLGECKVRINWIKARQDIPQGIDAAIHNARLKLLDGSNKETKRGFAFMYSGWKSGITPLLCVPIKFRSREKQQQKKWLMLHNIWLSKNTDGDMERCSWGGNYGVVIEKRGENIYRLYFSCGEVDHPNVTFEDLVVDVKIEGEYTTRFQCSKM